MKLKTHSQSETRPRSNQEQREAVLCRKHIHAGNQTRPGRVNIILHGETLDTFLLRQRARQGRPLSPFLLDIILKASASASREEKGNKTQKNRTGKKSKTIITCKWCNHRCLKKKSSRIFRQTILLPNEFSKSTGFKDNMQKPRAFLYASGNQKKK